jgi:hypothetical protein
MRQSMLNVKELQQALKKLCVNLVQKVRRLLKILKTQPKPLRKVNKMPLKKSMSIPKMIKVEVKAGKPIKQAVAIAYAVKSKKK